MVATHSSSRKGRSAYRRGYQGSSSAPRYRSKSVDDLRYHDGGSYSKSYGDNYTSSYDRDKYRGTSFYKGGSCGSAYNGSNKYATGGYADKYTCGLGDRYGTGYSTGKYSSSRVAEECNDNANFGDSSKETKSTTKYRVVGRITPSPEHKRKHSGSLTLPNVRKEKYYGRYTGGGRDFDSDLGGCLKDGKSYNKYDQDLGGRGYTDLSPYGGRWKYGGSASQSALPRPILRRPRSRERLHDKLHETLRRSRSLNDIVRSPSPKRHGIARAISPVPRDSPSKWRDGVHTPDGSFPVCSRFPNCSVCIIDIPQGQLVGMCFYVAFCSKAQASFKSTVLYKFICMVNYHRPLYRSFSSFI